MAYEFCIFIYNKAKTLPMLIAILQVFLGFYCLGKVVLKDKIESEARIPVTIPSLGESYDLDNDVQLTEIVKQPVKQRYLRLEVLNKMKTLKEELEDMETIVKEDYLNSDVDDNEIVGLKNKLKELENQIVKIVENK